MTLSKGNVYKLMKYSVYLLLMLNVVLFFIDEWNAVQHTGSDLDFSTLIQSFAASIDTLSWVVLLLLFELETFVLPDDVIKGRVKFTLHGIRVICYVFIVYSAYGYTAKAIGLQQDQIIPQTSLCAPELNNLSYMTELDEYTTITPENCATLLPENSPSEVQLHQLGRDHTIVSDNQSLSDTRKIAWVDVINSINWLIIVVLLEIDVSLQLSRSHRKRLVEKANNTAKIVCYSILFGAAAYWGIFGAFLDFWDALLWIVAFIFIELNVFQWQEETQAEESSATAPS